MALFNELDRLCITSASIYYERTGDRHRADGLRHARGARDDGEPAAAERRDGELALDVAELRLRVEHAGVVELGEECALGAGAVRVCRGEQRKPVRVLPELPT
jgi:hypothetical protein